MKKFILLLALTLTLSCCNKDDNPPVDPLSQLPPATQTGAGTFGCLINGVPYVDNSGDFNCFYQLVGGQYYFNITANFGDKTPKIISLATNALEINLNSNNQFLNNTPGNFYAEVTFDNNPPLFLNDNTTNINDTGTIKINHFSMVNKIISATFNFKIRDNVNNKDYYITEGRFDSFFTE